MCTLYNVHIVFRSREGISWRSLKTDCLSSIRIFHEIKKKISPANRKEGFYTCHFSSKLLFRYILTIKWLRTCITKCGDPGFLDFGWYVSENLIRIKYAKRYPRTFVQCDSVSEKMEADWRGARQTGLEAFLIVPPLHPSQYLLHSCTRLLILQVQPLNQPLPLKGLSHEIDFKTVEKKFTELGLTKGRGWFLNFLEAPMILKRKKYIYCG